MCHRAPRPTKKEEAAGVKPGLRKGLCLACYQLLRRRRIREKNAPPKVLTFTPPPEPKPVGPPLKPWDRFR